MLGWLALRSLQVTSPTSQSEGGSEAGTEEVDRKTGVVSYTAVEAALVALMASYVAPRAEASSGASAGHIEGKGLAQRGQKNAHDAATAVSHKYPQGQPLMRMDACR